MGARLGPAGRAASLALGWLCGVALQLQLRDLPPQNALLLATVAALPVSVSMSVPSWPTQALPSRLAMWPETKTRLPVRTKGT